MRLCINPYFVDKLPIQNKLQTSQEANKFVRDLIRMNHSACERFFNKKFMANI